MTKISYHRPGEKSPEVNVGDIILTHSTFLTGKIIRFGQRLRWRGARKQFAQWNHAALVIQPTFLRDYRTYEGGSVVAEVYAPARIAEALGHGVEENSIAKYEDTEYAVIHCGPFLTDDKIQIMNFAHSVLLKRARYGYLEILSLCLSLLTPPWVQFGTPGTMICSGFAAQALTRAGVVWPVDPSYAMPADIAEWFQVVGLP